MRLKIFTGVLISLKCLKTNLALSSLLRTPINTCAPSEDDTEHVLADHTVVALALTAKTPNLTFQNAAKNVLNCLYS